MKKSKKLILVLAALGMFAGRTFAKEITTSIIPGKMWSERAPQCAVWIEDENGIFLIQFMLQNQQPRKDGNFHQKKVVQILCQSGMEPLELILQHQL